MSYFNLQKATNNHNIVTLPSLPSGRRKHTRAQAGICERSSTRDQHRWVSMKRRPFFHTQIETKYKDTAKGTLWSVQNEYSLAGSVGVFWSWPEMCSCPIAGLNKHTTELTPKLCQVPQKKSQFGWSVSLSLQLTHTLYTNEYTRIYKVVTFSKEVWIVLTVQQQIISH